MEGVGFLYAIVSVHGARCSGAIIERFTVQMGWGEDDKKIHINVKPVIFPNPIAKPVAYRIRFPLPGKLVIIGADLVTTGEGDKRDLTNNVYSP